MQPSRIPSRHSLGALLVATGLVISTPLALSCSSTEPGVTSAAAIACAGDACSGAADTAAPPVFVLFFDHATLAATPASGGAWDDDGTAPDAFVQVLVAGEARCATSTRANTLTPDWHQSCEIGLAAGVSVEIVVLDEDGDDPPQLIGTIDASASLCWSCTGKQALAAPANSALTEIDFQLWRQ